MEISVTPGSVTIVAISGAIDSNTFPKLIAQTSDVVRQGNTNLVIDLRAVDYISSGGLVALQTIAGQVDARNGKVVLAGLTKRVAQVMSISGFADLLAIYPDVATARASFPQA